MNDYRLKFLTHLFILSYLLNFLWESLHAFLFYEGLDNFLSGDYVKLMLYVSGVDALMILACYLLTYLLVREFRWFKMRKGKMLFSLFAFAFAVFVEIKGVYIQNKWSYNDYMPVLFGLGLSPLLQLILTGLIA